MFECSACMLRCFRAIAGEEIRARPIPRRRLPLTRLPVAQPFRRNASTSPRHRPSRDGVDPLVAGNQPIVENAEPLNARDTKKFALRDTRALRTELKYLPDRFKLQEHVHYTLRRNNPSKALELCRLASKNGNVVVSWNRCVDWHMSKNKINDALKIYNEMKKRAQFPDSHTYMALLKGLAVSHHHGQPVKEENVTRAVSIYNSMSSPTSRVKPNILHTNAVLRVCSMAVDTDALWGVASKLPSQGAGSADSVTYTTLLHAIRLGAFGKNPQSSYIEQIAARRQQAISEGRRIWLEVISRWRGGEVHIDEQLVSAMGQLLLVSSRMHDWDDVLSLVKQTMNIERQIAPIGSPERQIEHVPQANDHRTASSEESPKDHEDYLETPDGKAFTSAPRENEDTSNIAYARPGNQTLSLLISACSLLRTPKTATAYWDMFTTGPNAIKPDLANFHASLRLLGKNRASAQAVRLLTTGMTAADVEPNFQTFRIAMSICVRDKNNHKVHENAGAVLDVMQRTCADPDLHTLTQYLNLALTTDKAENIVTALNRLDPFVQNMRSRVSYGAVEKAQQPSQHLADKQQVVHFTQVLVGVIDTLMNRGMVPRDDFTHWHERRAKLTKFIGTAKKGIERMGGRIEAEEDGGAKLESDRSEKPEKRGGVEANMDWGLRLLRRRGRGEAILKESRRAHEEDEDEDLGAWGGRAERRPKKKEQSGVRPARKPQKEEKRASVSDGAFAVTPMDFEGRW